MSRYETKIPATGSDGNIFAILGTAVRWMRQLGVSEEEVKALQTRVHRANNYDAACAAIEEWFPLDRGDE